MSHLAWIARSSKHSRARPCGNGRIGRFSGPGRAQRKGGTRANSRETPRPFWNTCHLFPSLLTPPLFISPHRSLLSSSLFVGGAICGGSSSTAASIFDSRRRAANSPLFRVEELHPHVGSTASSHLLLKDFVNGGKSIPSPCMARNRPRSVDPLLFVCLH